MGLDYDEERSLADLHQRAHPSTTAAEEFGVEGFQDDGSRLPT